jgi:TetR/AcrR family transcriptional regulator
MGQIELGEATRDRVLRLADALFARRGYAAVSMRDVAVASGVTKPALYYHFRDKDALFAEVVLVHQLQLGEKLSGAVEGGDTLSDRVNAVAAVLVSAADHHPVRTRSDALEHLPDDIRQRVDSSFDDNVMAPLVRLFTEAHAAGQLRPGMTPQLAAAALVGLCTALLPGVGADEQSNGHAGPGDQARRVAELALHGVAG